ncbi:hypothetical protein K450DRAFT_247770 [Umbelopsis ramanniana AG]|uniref:Uncharacterized protein n=1 Tax=Umbelopsis ramanniana AG TaxID=1314678 RepID=A0AAD5E6Q8_UMBRA|nr:uncharacterized protein K450DRAFT_247770 [Umbelopsis ramanniana AG]KAI8578406.1 hypothetical protein K450DRAFT_247770 [Umbelopsis ramanniana AG]
MFLASQPLATFEGLNATTDLQAVLSEDIEKGFQRQGGTIRNETIPLHEDIPEEVTKQQTNIPHLRPIDYVFSERSLKYLHTITAEYFRTPLTEAFNWNEAAERLGEEQEGEWFIVAFRSIRNEQADHKKLYDADALAHEEAIRSGGLLKYWYGTLNENRECLAMCIWSNRDFAKIATTKPLHLKAVSLARQMYESYQLERYQLVKRKGENHFHIVPL